MKPVSTELLRRYPLFADLTEESLVRLAMLSERRSFGEGSLLFREGDPAEHLMVVLEGSVDVFTQLPDGERRIVGVLVEGDLTAWSALLEPHRMRFGAVAREPTTVLTLAAPGLRDLVADDHEMGYRIMRRIAVVLSQHLEGTRVQLAAHP